jgi:hypothetical protein
VCVCRWRCCDDKQEKGVLAEIYNLNNVIGVIFTHCAICRNALAAERFAPDPEILQEAVTVANFNGSRALNSRLFQIFAKP